ncbi:MAG: hypothetical protein H6704_29380 [Myxococcales bacterium]|nr:hypothetical protein [Myxococcales bacterium]
MSSAPRLRFFAMALALWIAGCGPRPRPPRLTPPEATTQATRRAYDQAVAAFDAGDLSAARDGFRALVTDAHVGPLARLYLGRIELARGEAEAAADRLDALAADDAIPRAVRDEARFHAALASAAAERCAEAEPVLRAATDAPDAPRRADAHEALARCAVDDAAAVGHLAAAAEAGPDAPGRDRGAARASPRSVGRGGARGPGRGPRRRAAAPAPVAGGRPSGARGGRR